ncbi:MAG: hypothetical protein LUD76_00190 [Alistipes sp.]|nr:hypothetical protein [Alistipes sp.]
MKRQSILLLLALSATLLTARTPNTNAVTYGEAGIGEIKFILGQLGYEFYKLRLPVDAW